MTEFIVGLIFGIALTLVVVRIALTIAVRRAEATIQALEQAINVLNSSTISARVEEHDGVFYVYNAEDGTFLVQGSSMTELQEKLDSQYQNKNIVVTEGDESVLARLKNTGAV